MPNDASTESSQQAALRRLQLALDEHALVSIADPQGRIIFANDKFCAVSKYSREELLGADHRIVNSRQHPPEFFRQLWAAISSGKTWKGEICNRAKDGTIYWVSSTIVPFLNAEGRPYQYVAIRTDITERKRTEESLHNSLLSVKNLEMALDQFFAAEDIREIRVLALEAFESESLKAQEAFNGQNFKRVGEVIHNVKSVAATFNFDRLGEVSLSLEAAARAGDQTGVAEIFPIWHAKLGEAIADLKR